MFHFKVTEATEKKINHFRWKVITSEFVVCRLSTNVFFLPALHDASFTREKKMATPERSYTTKWTTVRGNRVPLAAVCCYAYIFTNTLYLSCEINSGMAMLFVGDVKISLGLFQLCRRFSIGFVCKHSVNRHNNGVRTVIMFFFPSQKLQLHNANVCVIKICTFLLWNRNKNFFHFDPLFCVCFDSVILFFFQKYIFIIKWHICASNVANRWRILSRSCLK